MPRFVLALLMLLCCAATTAQAAPQTITVGGIVRTYLQVGQPGSDPEPLIIALHGLGESGMVAAQATHFGVLAPSAGYIAVFPDGLAHQWNHYPAGQVLPIAKQDYAKAGVPIPDDVAFINAIIDKLVQANVVDPKRVYLMGFSAGGFMAMKLVCEDEDRFAALALIATNIPSANGETCAPPRPMPVLMEHGTADDHVPYDGGLVLMRTFTVWSADKLTQFFAKLDKCTGDPATSQIQAKLPTELSAYSCDAGPVDFYKVTNGRHVVYQFPPPALTMWNFFKVHSL